MNLLSNGATGNTELLSLKDLSAFCDDLFRISCFAMSLLLSLIFGESWLQTWILEGSMPLFTLLIATPILHRGVNIIGFKIGIKNEPW